MPFFLVRVCSFYDIIIIIDKNNEYDKSKSSYDGKLLRSILYLQTFVFIDKCACMISRALVFNIQTSSVTVFCEESVDGMVDPNMSIRSAVSLSEDVQVIECSEHPPSPEQSCPEISSEHAMTFQNVSYSVRGFNKCHWTTKTILTNVR